MANSSRLLEAREFESLDGVNAYPPDQTGTAGAGDLI
jgi:hypothetical protein